MTEQDELLVKALQLVKQYLDRNAALDTLVVDYQSPESLKAKLNLSIPEKGVSVDQLLDRLETYLTYSVRTGHKQFFNQLFSGFTVPGFLGDVFTSLTNTSMATYEIAPVATLIEKELIQTMNQRVGFTHGEGIFVTGGSHANLMGMLCARNQAFPNAKRTGMSSHNLVLFVSEQSHYSYLKAANVLGIGQDNVIKVETDANGRMMPQKLDAAIASSLAAGKQPFFIGATAGTTVMGAFDPLVELAELAQQYHLWLHVDGAWGAVALLSDRHRHLLTGSELADSFAWDAHKGMGIPLTCSAFLVKHNGILEQTCTCEDTDYLFHPHEHSAYDLGVLSLQCGRKVDALKLWLSWQYYGDRGYEARIDRLFDLATYATEKVKAYPELELMVPTQFFNLCFRYRPSHQLDIDAFNLTLRDRLVKSGKSLVNYASLNGNVIIRLVIANPEIEPADIDRFFETLLAIGQALDTSIEASRA